MEGFSIPWDDFNAPITAFKEHLRIGFALYSSAGALDLECRDKMSIVAVQDLICTLVLLTFATRNPA